MRLLRHNENLIALVGRSLHDDKGCAMQAIFEGSAIWGGRADSYHKKKAELIRRSAGERLSTATCHLPRVTFHVPHVTRALRLLRLTSSLFQMRRSTTLSTPLPSHCTSTFALLVVVTVTGAGRTRPLLQRARRTCSAPRRWEHSHLWSSSDPTLPSPAMVRSSNAQREPAPRHAGAG